MNKFGEYSKKHKIYFAMKRIKLEKLFTLGIILLLFASTFSTFTFQIGSSIVYSMGDPNADIEPITLPHTWNYGITCYYLDLDLSREGYQQSITVKPGQNVEAEIKFQRWSGAGNPSEINQVFLLYSWSTSWNPPSMYTPLWDGISGAYPGITKVVRFSFIAPKEPGTYYIWIRGDAMYTMEDALSNIWNKYHGQPPYSDDGGGIIGKVVVAEKEEGVYTSNELTTTPSPSPTTIPPKTTSPTLPFTKPSEQSMDIMNIIGPILVIIAVLVFILAAVFYFRGRKPATTKRIRYPEEKPPPVLASEKEHPTATKTLEETISKEVLKVQPRKPSILSIEATKLSVDEWGKIIVNVKGKGKVSINLEGDVDWKDPGINEISGESTIEIPVKPKVSGDVPVNIIIDTPYGKESSMIFLKVEKKEVIPPQFVTPTIEKVGLEEIIPFRNIPLKNLVSGYGCSSSKVFKVNLLSPTVPKEFEGVWDCCLLGCGGWGCAYLATRGNEKIVIKVPRGFESVIEGGIEAPTSHEALLKKIRSETEIMGSLNHPNIIKFLGASSRIPLVIYEFADYGSLYWQIIKGWRPSLRDAVLIGIQLGDALRYIHSRGLIHGDIKPSNVFIKNGVAKLGDFSSTVKLLSSVSISKLSYTVGFRAPEQVYLELKRKAKELGVENRIDIYQLGNLLLYILTGESIDGEDADDEKLVMEKLSMIPNEELRAILAEALKLEPDKRPSAEEFTKKLYNIWRKIAQ
jgi:tRNA A-37 threonylcarbamoyl transferase component Bud32